MTPTTIETTAVAVRESSSLVKAEDFMPVLSVQQAVEKKNMMNQFIGQVLRETQDGADGDYGAIPGAKKKILLKPGAEKLCSIFGLAPQYLEDKIVEDWTGEQHGGEALFYYSYRCSLTRGTRFMGEAIGSCNSWETKYRYRWIAEDLAKDRPDFERLPKRGGKKTIFEPNFALDKMDTTGKYAKTQEYWDRFNKAIQEGVAKGVRKKLGPKTFEGWEMTVDETQYRVPNPDVADIINTCQKMAQKRALVAAVLVVTNCSDAFMQDMEDFVPSEAPSEPLPPPKPEPTVDDEKEQLRQTIVVAAGNYLKKFVALGAPQEFRRIMGTFGYAEIDEIPVDRKKAENLFDEFKSVIDELKKAK